MATYDLAFEVKKALENNWTPALPVTITLHVDDNYRPDSGPVLLVANDGGPSVTPGPWVLHGPATGRGDIRRPLLRLTAFAKGRTNTPPLPDPPTAYGARNVVEDAADWLVSNRPPGMGRIQDISDPLITRDRGTGAFLASVLLPVLINPI